MTPADRDLFRAIDRQDPVGVRAALDEGADVDARRRCNTPLLDAVFSKNPEVVSILVHSGAMLYGVSHSRDPLREAFTQGDLPTLAALFDAPPTATGLAGELLKPDHWWLREPWVRQCLMGARWKDVFMEIVPRIDFSNPANSEGWWHSACKNYLPDPISVQALNSHAPITREPSYFRSIAMHGLPVCILQTMDEAGHLDADTMFHAPLGKGQGLIEAALRQSYPPMPSVRWLMRKAAKMVDAHDTFAQRGAALMALSLGKHASLPLANILGKSLGMDIFAMASQARTIEGNTTLQLLFDEARYVRRRLVLAEKLMQAGADPMDGGSVGRAACYGACLIQGHGHEPLELIERYGADLSRGGILEQSIERDATTPVHILAAAKARLAEYQAHAQAKILQHATTPIEYQRPRRRF